MLGRAESHFLKEFVYIIFFTVANKPYQTVRVIRKAADEYGFLMPAKFEHHNYAKMEKCVCLYFVCADDTNFN